MHKLLALILCFWGTTILAFDAQCEKLTKAQAIQAQLTIEKVSKKVPDLMIVDQYCEYCMDPYPRPIVIDEVEVDHDQNSYFLKINGEKIDIAFIYVDNKNLAHAAGCKTIAISETIGN